MRFSTLLFLVTAVSIQSSCHGFVSIGTPSSLRRHTVPATFVSSLPISETTTTVEEQEEKDALSPAFAAAHDKAIAALENSIDNDALLTPLKHFVREYMVANQMSSLSENSENSDLATPEKAVERVLQVIQFGMTYGMGDSKYTFDVTHEALRGKHTTPHDTLDFYEFGCNFFKPCMDLAHSPVLGQDHLQQAFAQVKNGENVVFFANHQSEADPQVFSLLLEKIGYGKEASQVTYVAGHKVTTDPLAIPFSMGRNLLCIHSKKHIDTDPTLKAVKQRQNMATMSAMLSKLKSDEGLALWVAPSGGRDRRNVETGHVPIADFDSKTIDMFRLMGLKSKKPTHFYPLAMVSYDLCPPPDTIEASVGEERNIRFVPVGIACGAAVPSRGGLESRHLFSQQCQEICQQGYDQLLEEMNKNKK